MSSSVRRWVGDRHEVLKDWVEQDNEGRSRIQNLLLTYEEQRRESVNLSHIGEVVSSLDLYRWKITTLNLSENNISQFDHTFCLPEKLKILLMINNPLLANLPSFIGPHLTRLDLTGCGFSQFFCEKDTFLSLRSLSLSRNQFTIFPAGLLKITSLEVLDLSENHISELPLGVSVLLALKSINVSHNLLQTLPWSLCYMKNLEDVDASYNYLEELPSEIYLLTKLSSLIVTSNRLKKIPPLNGCVEKFYREVLRKIP